MKKKLLLFCSVIAMAICILLLLSNIRDNISYHTYVYEPDTPDAKSIVIENCKLLCVGSDFLDLQKKDGSVMRYKRAQDMVIFTDESEKQYADLSDLQIGNNQATFVMDRGHIITKAYCGEKQILDTVRVLIQSSDYGGRYHDEIVFTPACDMRIISGRKHTICKSGKPIRITPGSSFFMTDHIVLTPQNPDAVTAFPNIRRAIGAAYYSGSFEVIRSEEGLILVNEVLLEQYLYRVVPSEMPASSPIEALKAQAICARTYAGMHILASSLRAYGAHMDDSTSFQVYGNIQQTDATNRAVLETKGNMLFAGDALCETYFYSTSCGYSSGIDVWHVDHPQNYTYLKAGSISRTVLCTPQALSDETVFRDYLSTPHVQDYEVDDPFYRWSYTTKVEHSLLLTKVNKRKEADEEMIIIAAKDGKALQSISALEVGAFEGITVTKRLSGGAMDEIEISYENATITVIGERNIREVLVGTDPDIRLNHDVKSSVASMLPSAYAYIDMIYREDQISGYRVVGGGYGHGIGMSQNAAKHMAEDGMNCEQILMSFYEGKLREITSEKGNP